MQEIRTSGSMSGDGKRSVAAWPKLPRPSSTLPNPKCQRTPLTSGDSGKADLIGQPRSTRQGKCAKRSNDGSQNEIQWMHPRIELGDLEHLDLMIPVDFHSFSTNQLT